MKKNGKPEREERTDKDRVSRIEDISEAMFRLASGDFSVRLETSPQRDELDALAVGVSILAGELGSMVGELKDVMNYTDNIIRSLADSLVLVDPEANIITVNRETCELLGYSEDELTGKPVAMLFAEEEEEEEEEEVFQKAGLLKLIDAGTIRNYEMTFRTREGKEIPVLLNGSVMRDEDEKIMGVLCIARDVTERKRVEEALRASEEHLHFITGNVPDVIWTTDLSGNLTYVSPSVEHQMGYTVEEAMSLTLEEYMTPSSLEVALDRLARELEIERETVSDPPIPVIFEVELYRKDGTTFWAELHGGFLRGADDTPYGVLGTIRDIAERKRTEDEIRRLSRKVIDEHEESRSKMAADLHDEVGQSLNALKIEMDLLAMEAGNTLHGQTERLEGMRVLIEDIIDTVRNLSGELRPLLLDDFGLEKALEMYLEEFSEGAGVAASLECSGVPRALPKDKELSLYRIAQEALTNVQRHADAREARVSLTCKDKCLTLIVEDDGRGFDLQTALRGSTPGPHFGILGMRERASLTFRVTHRHMRNSAS